MRMRFEKGRNKRRNKVKKEEAAGLLNGMDDKKEESSGEEMVVGENENESESELKRFDFGSKWKNIESVLGSSILHWFVPLDWTEEELCRRMMDEANSFDIMPCKTKR